MKLRPTVLPARPFPAVLPDVAVAAPPRAGGRIDRVGMEGIFVPVRLRDAEGRLVVTPGRCDVFVSLDAEAKGIHMSRLYLLLQQTLEKEELCAATLETLLHGLVHSHASLSRSAAVAVHADFLMQQRALASGHAGWKRHPVTLAARLSEGRFESELTVGVAYSSTCPCSAALSREIQRDRFVARFGATGAVDAGAVAEWLRSEAGLPATPHSQRSHAEVTVCLAGETGASPFAWLVDRIESALGTPVQSAVKREDEQAFAALNAANLLFCEDAVRRIRHALEDDGRILDYRVKVRHEESLHPHDAVAAVTRGVPGGLRAS